MEEKAANKEPNLLTLLCPGFKLLVIEALIFSVISVGMKGLETLFQKADPSLSGAFLGKFSSKTSLIPGHPCWLCIKPGYLAQTCCLAPICRT